MNRTWMHKGVNYTFNDFDEVNEQVIISTDVRALRIPVSQIQQFAKDLLPVEDRRPKGLAIRGLDNSMLQELSAGLMESFREISQCSDPGALKTAVQKAKSKVKITTTVTNVAKVIIEAQRIQDK